MRSKPGTYVAFLRGINVGGRHKIPMATLRNVMETVGFSKVVTLLNSGNIIFESVDSHPGKIGKKISGLLESTFGFPVPTIVRKSSTIIELVEGNPFGNIEVTADIRFYVSFLKNEPKESIPLPWTSEDGSCIILENNGMEILSVLNLSIAPTPRAMAALEKFYGKDITTRNWKTIERIAGKLKR